jgi:hypothetical protein
MNGKIARTIAIAVTGSVLTVSGAGVASADSVGDSSTQAASQQLLQLRDQLTKTAYGADVQGTKLSLDQLSPVLGEFAAGDHPDVRSDVPNMAATADEESTEASRILANPAQAATARQLPPVPSLPDLPPPLNIVSDLLKNLLTTVTGLLGSLLGGGVPPLPVPVGLPTPPVNVPTPPVGTPTPPVGLPTPPVNLPTPPVGLPTPPVGTPVS